MVKSKLSVWDWLAYFALASIVVWTILKITGVINTPLLVQYYPVLAACYAYGWQMNKLNVVAGDVVELKKFQAETVREIHGIKINCARNHGK